jgi:hypothetical protein
MIRLKGLSTKGASGSTAALAFSPVRRILAG